MAQDGKVEQAPRSESADDGEVEHHPRLESADDGKIEDVPGSDNADDGKIEQVPRVDGAQAVLGTLVALSRWVTDNDVAPGAHGAAEGRGPDLRYVALGAASLIEDRVRDAVGVAARAGRAVYGPFAPLANRLVPAFIRQQLRDGVNRLDGHGRATAAAGADRAARLADAAADDLAREPIVLRTVEQMVEQLQWHIVDELLPGVLERLAAEPDQVRTIVQGQSRGMVDELTQTARTRAVEGDEAVDRLLSRLLHRKATRREVPRPATSEPGPAPAPASGAPQGNLSFGS